jgi:hypothetical protein
MQRIEARLQLEQKYLWKIDRVLSKKPIECRAEDASAGNLIKRMAKHFSGHPLE